MNFAQRNRADDFQREKIELFQSKEYSFGLIKIVPILVIFASGVVLGLVASSQMSRYLVPSTDLFFPICQTKGSCENISNISKPSALTHNLRDEELFWKASMVPKREEYPFKRVPKVAFLFLTRGPLPLSPLWDRFFFGHKEFYSIYVHTIPGYLLDVSNTSAFYDRQIPNQAVTWGSISLLDAERRLLANALLDYSNERFVLLSESCIPIYSFSTVYDYLINSKDSFVESFDEPSRYTRGRYHRGMAPEINVHQWRKGSQWFELSRELAVSIISDTKYYPIFKKYCKPSCYPDEHYIPTYLNMFHKSLNSNRSVTWADWSIRAPHPATYGGLNITKEFIMSIRHNVSSCLYNYMPSEVCYLFARKFSPSALQPLLNLSSTILSF